MLGRRGRGLYKKSCVSDGARDLFLVGKAMVLSLLLNDVHYLVCICLLANESYVPINHLVIHFLH